MCTFKIPLIYLKTLEHLAAMYGYGTIAVFVKALGFYKMRGFCVKSN